jgi:hypothetical protein
MGRLVERRYIFLDNLTKEYSALFNAIIDAENSLEAIRSKLISALNAAEELYISRDDTQSNT